jgi:autotransporter-associated beta strand protein
MINFQNLISRISIVLLLILSFNFTYSQTTVYWRTDGPSDGKWLWGSTCDPAGDGQWYYSVWGGFRQAPDCYGSHNVFFDGNGINTMNLNSRDFGFQTLTFTTNATAARTLNADGALRLFLNNVSGTPKIENLSSTGHIINAPLTFNALSELNPVNGDLSFQAINNNGNELNVWGDNAKNIIFNGIISGSGKFVLKQYSNAKFGAANTYTGNTEIDKGELWIESAGGISASSAIFLGNASQMSSVAKFWLSNPAGGTTFSRNITVNDGNATTRYIGGINTSGTHTYSGNITNNSSTGGLILQSVSAGGNTNFSGILSGSNYVVEGPGVVTLSGASDNTFTGTMTVNSGTLVLNKSAGIKAIPQLPSAMSINAGGTVRTDAANQFGAGAMPCLITMNGNAVFDGNNTNQKIAVVSASATSSISMGSGTLTIDNTTTDTYAGTISGSGGLIKTNVGTQVFTNVGNNYTGNTTITQGVLQLGAAGVITNTSNIVMNGGAFNTGSGAGFSETVGTLTLNANSIIALGTGAHNLNFANSNAASWTANTFLTITGWTGGFNGTTGTAGKIFVGSDATGLTSQQLSQIYFNNGTNNFTALLLSTGELVPSSNIVIPWTNAAASTAWYTSTNWTPSTASGAWTTSNIAQFNNTGTATTAGINMGTASLSVGAIDVTSLRTRALTVSNSSATGGNLTLNGANLRGQDNTIFSNNSNSLLTLQNGSGTMGIVLGNATDNIINISGTGGITISSIIQGASRNLSKSGTGSGVLTLSGVNTYGGNTTINGGTLAISGANRLPTGTSLILANAVGANFSMGANNQTVASISGGGSSGGNITGSGTLTLNQNSNTSFGGTISSSVAMTKSGTGSLTMTNTSFNSIGLLRISSGEIRLNPSSTSLLMAFDFEMNGGKLSTTSISTNTFASLAGTLKLNASSSIDLGSNVHTINFNPSEAVVWTAGQTLTINGWTGTAGASGTAGRIFVGTSNTHLTSGQLDQINFAGYDPGATILSTGEIVPRVVVCTVAPTSLLISSATICNGSSITLTQSGGTLGSGATWRWYSDASFTTLVGSSSAANASLVLSPIASTTYYLRAEGNSSPCSSNLDAPGSVSVTVNQPSIAPSSLNGTATICNGSSTNLTQTGGSLGSGATWRWYSDAGFTTLVGSSSDANANLSVSPTVTTTYYLRAEGTTSPCTGNVPALGNVTISVLPAVNYGTIDEGHIVISQVYGAGGNAGAVYKNDYVELFNPTNEAVSLNTFSLQYASSAGTAWSKCNLSGVIAPKSYFLVKFTPGVNGADLPGFDLDGAAAISMAAGAGKIALISNQTALGAVSCPSSVIDFVGYGPATNCAEGSPTTSNLSTVLAAFRKNGGCIETNSNSEDFSTALPNPRYSASPTNDCGLNQNLCVSGKSNPISVNGSIGSPSFTYQWYYQDGIVSAPVGTSTTGWTSLGSSDGANTRVYEPSSSLTASRTFACFVTPGGSPTCGTGTWAAGAKQVTVNLLPTATAGTTINSFVGEYETISGASASNGTIQWTEDGAGNFDEIWFPVGNDETVAPTYSVIEGDWGNTITLTMTVTGLGACSVNTATANVTININDEPGLWHYQCGTTTPYIDEYIYVYNVPGATNYRIRIDDGINPPLVREQTSTVFFFRQFPEAEYNTTYTCDVDAFVGGSWVGYGPTCEVTTPDIPVTKVAASQCGTSLATVNTTIFADNVWGVELYEFSCFDGVTTQTFQTANRFFNLTQLASYAFSTTYAITVRTRTNGVWTTFGTSCNVTTPAQVCEIVASQCGITLVNNGIDVYCNLIPNTTIYEFRLVNGGTTLTIQKPSRTFKFSQVNGCLPGVTYAVSIRTYTNGSWSTFGPSCNITSATSTSKIIASQCGTTLTNIDLDLYADAIVGATQYRFRVANSGGTLTILKSSRTFKLSQLANAKYGEVNTIDVDAYVNGAWIGYGVTCELTTPSLPTTKLQTSQCDITLGTTSTYLYANAIFGASQYRFRAVNVALSYNQIITKTGRFFRMSEFSGLTINTPYELDVAVYINGAWQSYGAVCTITTPGVLALPILENDIFADLIDVQENDKIEILEKELSSNIDNFKIEAWPNPFSDRIELRFSDNYSAQGKIIVYDGMGKIVEQINLNELINNSLHLGSNYSKGIYLISISDETQTQSIKVVKN